jgi:hypothetical protein
MITGKKMASIMKIIMVAAIPAMTPFRKSRKRWSFPFLLTVGIFLRRVKNSLFPKRDIVGAAHCGRLTGEPSEGFPYISR